MEHGLSVTEKDLLDWIGEKTQSKSNSIHSVGLLDGKMGIVLFLYKYSQFRQSPKAQEEADAMVDEVWESVHMDRGSFSFLTGQSGVAWGLFQLVKKRLLEMDNELMSYIGSVDFYIYKEQKTKNPVVIDIESGLFTAGIYHLCRSLHSPEDYQWREDAIYLIEDCERILFRTTGYNNIFLPEFTLSLLNSILYFLIEVHQQRIYPYKTTILLKEVCSLIIKHIKLGNLQDRITSKCLLLLVDKDIFSSNVMDVDLTVDFLSGTDEQTVDVLDVLSESGLYALLYNNGFIFRESYIYVRQHCMQDLNILYNKLAGEEIPIKTLLGIGLGLLTMLGEDENKK